ncbi:hypothetical protein JHK86_039543 [Glycine max]|nr:hypothetical protein JHK86_039543 [Glycine max]
MEERVYELRGNTKCSGTSKGPPCTGFMEGMAPVFSRSSWYCTWLLIQGEHTQNVGVMDSEFVVHKGIQTLGGSDDPTKTHCVIQNQRRECREDNLAPLQLRSEAKAVKLNFEKTQCSRNALHTTSTTLALRPSIGRIQEPLIHARELSRQRGNHHLLQTS